MIGMKRLLTIIGSNHKTTAAVPLFVRFTFIRLDHTIREAISSTITTTITSSSKSITHPCRNITITSSIMANNLKDYVILKKRDITTATILQQPQSDNNMTLQQQQYKDHDDTSSLTLHEKKKEDVILQSFSSIPFTSTCDLYDTLLDNVRIPILSNGDRWISYGNISKFSGTVVTVKCYEDNSRVKAILEDPSYNTTNNNNNSKNCKVLVVDGGGSKHCALLGDMIATSAVANHWNGIIIYGCIRDVEILKTLSIGIIAIGCTPRKSNRRNDGQSNIPISIGNVPINHNNDYVFVDDNGIIFVDKNIYHEQQEGKQQQMV